MIETPTFDLPLRFSGDIPKAVEVEQDSIDDIANCVAMVLRTEVGTRFDDPDFGIPDPTFRREPDVELIISQIEEYEPRARIQIESLPDFEDFVNQVIIEVREERSSG